MQLVVVSTSSQFLLQLRIRRALEAVADMDEAEATQEMEKTRLHSILLGEQRPW